MATIYGYDLQCEHFEQECYEKGYAELAALMKDGIVWADICWDSFAYFAELYKPLPKMLDTAMMLPSPIEDGDKQNKGKLDYQSVTGRRPVRDPKE